MFSTHPSPACTEQSGVASTGTTQITIDAPTDQVVSFEESASRKTVSDAATTWLIVALPEYVHLT